MAFREMDWWPHDRQVRFLPKQGKPECVVEWGSQRIVRAAPVLTLIIVVITLALQVWILL